ncbi:MAG: DUF72 domain-containing protein [Deltaproteobacteria bacterium]|nr:DUF72 domain-containing protein [Deltaproteobacteria bacterium]
MTQSELFAAPQREHPYRVLGDELWALARRGIYFGTSSWKYESWKDAVYCDEYKTKKHFDQNCLGEYARIFPAVGGDFSFYNWPGEELIANIARQTPEGFKIGLKATEFITLKRFPAIARWGAKAGQPNPDFLNPRLFKEKFLDRLVPLRGKLAPIIVEFTAFPRGAFSDWTEFAKELEAFFCQLGKLCGREHEFGVELRTKEFIHDDFYAALKAMNAFVPVAPIVNSWTRTPPLDEQWKLVRTQDFAFNEVRLMMRPGRTRDEAVQLFEPYARIRERVPVVRRALAAIVQDSLAAKRPCYVFMNNHLEGCSHQTIAELAADLLTLL